MDITRVVVGVDGSASADTALAVAVDQARELGAGLHIVSAMELPPSLPAYSGAYREAAFEVVERGAVRAAAALGDSRVDTQVVSGSPATALLGELHRDDLLVVGSHGHRPVARMLLGSTSTTVAAHAPCPVLVVRGPRVRTLGPVVVGVDGSTTSVEAVRLAAAVADRESATLRAVLALSPVTDALGFVSGPDDPQVSEAQAVLAEAVAGIAVDHPDLAVDRVVAQTHPVEALLRHARGARLVVVGSRGLGGLEAMLLGSVSREVLHHSSCPVLVVRSARDRQPA